MHKVIIPTVLVSNDKIIETKTSLYRPETKNGDPRIWIYQLAGHAAGGDLIAIGYDGEQLIAVNCSSTDLPAFLDRSGSPANSLKVSADDSEVFLELLGKLTKICDLGFVATKRAGDTGIGFTLETLLGVQANSSKKPDYKGIELKASRERTTKTGQSTMFSQVPNWELSRLKSSRHILEERGRYNVEKQRNQLFHEISSKAPNSYSLQLDVTDEHVHQNYVPDDGQVITDVSWLLSKLQTRFLQKHKESVWVTAQTRGKKDSEEFWYSNLKHTQGIDTDAFPILLKSGAISVHYLIKETPSGGAKDQGYLFKTASKNLDLLFDSVTEYDLSK